MKTFNLLLVNLGRTRRVPPQLALGWLQNVVDVQEAVQFFDPDPFKSENL